jgi:hypothetical protein
LRVRLGHPRWRRILSLRPYWRGGDHQDGNNQPQVHEYLLGYPAAMMTPNPKKSHKIKIHYASGSGGTSPCGVRFLRFLF